VFSDKLLQIAVFPHKIRILQLKKKQKNPQKTTKNKPTTNKKPQQFVKKPLQQFK